MNADELKKADEIVRALRAECSDCSEKSCCDRGNNPVKYCPIIDAADLIDNLTAQLAASQRREKAAVEDLEELMDRRIPLCYACQFCATDNRPCLVKGHMGECKPKWRGPQEAEKGEAE